ncbi:PEP-CTERM protein-sorting domain-containing protein [Marinobacter zhejiangensis]|uniref:PEP-CTERM protein-sorting domain-containing protein n=2 Tax=Marinobacter zhejiangensis TaxID=488535 RepID=A0A1I4MH34_9GAMM|nr:PEP-CTERM protein-sorting domain-containing protein [Marinobacter zhejiangensis]
MVLSFDLLNTDGHLEVRDMKRMTNGLAAVAATVLASLFLVAQVNAAPVLCSEDTTKNHMSIDDSQVDACLASGVGNIQGDNAAQDLFLSGPAGAGYEFAGKYAIDDGGTGNTFNITYGEGTWSFDSSFWDIFSEGAIGFKFGTGNTPDEWFVYSLQDLVSSGNWELILGDGGKGGGLSHVNLYGIRGPVDVPEPGTLGLVGMGVLLLSLSQRRKKA